MKNLTSIFVLAIATIVLSACDLSMQADTTAEMAEGDYERGPNNGRVLRDGDMVVELAIFESGVPPEFRAWVTSGGRILEPADVEKVPPPQDEPKTPAEDR